MTSRDREADGYPNGLRWRLTSRLTARNRAQRYQRFLRETKPGPRTTILDVGVTDSVWRSGNFLESSYPWPERITAVSIADSPTFRRHFPDVRCVVADGRALPFQDEEFDVGFSNAVVEHVGSRAQQRQFVAELVRTCRVVYLSTPNAWFPVDPHTLLPFVHWLPRRVRNRVLRATGHAGWASEAALNPLSVRQLRSMAPAGTDVTVIRQRLLGLTTVVTLVIRRLPDTSGVRRDRA